MAAGIGGGNLVVHEIHQEKNGELSVSVPATVRDAFGNRLAHTFVKGAGMVGIGNGTVAIQAQGGYGVATAGKMPGVCRIDTTVVFEKDTRACGLTLRMAEDFEKTYYIRLEPRNNKLVFDRWPRDRAEVSQMVELSRDLTLTPGVPVRLQVFADGNKGVVYANETIAMNFRMYDLPEGDWGIFASEGSATFKDLGLFTR